MNNNLILVTGASGLIGTHLVNELTKRGERVRAIIHSRNHYFGSTENIEIVRGDLTNPDFCIQICKGIDDVFHLAVETGSIVKNWKHPASIMTTTVLMDFNMLRAAHEQKVQRYLYSSCSCVYPAELEEMEEELAWTGPPPHAHETISWSKRISELQCKSFHKEYAMKIAIVRPSNTYGPFDIFDSENSHVISAFIQKAVRKIDPFVIWGDGEQIREFIYADDIAKGMIDALDKHAIADPINLAGGTVITIKDLARIIVKLAGYSPRIEFDNTKPKGHMKRILSARKSREVVGFVPTTPLEIGLRKTIEWYRNNIKEGTRC